MLLLLVFHFLFYTESCPEVPKRFRNLDVQDIDNIVSDVLIMSILVEKQGLYLWMYVYVYVSGAGLASVSVRPQFLSTWMETGVHGVSGACAAEHVELGLDSGRESAITHRKPSQTHTH